jgi:hypothetical protein
MARLLFDHVYWTLTGSVPERVLEEKSIRKIVSIKPSDSGQNDMDQMMPLRQGR